MRNTPNGMILDNMNIAVIGLGYVGYHMAAECSRRYPTVGFDISDTRNSELRDGLDKTGEVDDLSGSPQLNVASDFEQIRDCNDYIIAVPTPVNSDMRLRPGLVADHCIGVDHYYLLHRAMRACHVPDIIRTAREMNNGIPRQVVQRLARSMIGQSIPVNDAKVLVLGATFEENCPDIRNTKTVDLVASMTEWGIVPSMADPLAYPAELGHVYGASLVEPQ